MLTKTVTTVSVTKPQEGLFVVTYNLAVKEDGIEQLNQDFSEHYKPDQSTIGEVGTKIKNAMQKAIDKYKQEKAIKDNPQVETARVAIEAALEV
jgi:hypothetical protein